MKTWPRLLGIAGLLTVVFLLSPAPAAGQSAPKTIRPGAPGEPSRTLKPGEGNASVRARYVAADVQFMQGMIPHHAQALEMTHLLATRSERPEMHLLARRIEVAQRDEIAWMQRWLQDRGGEVPDLDAPHSEQGAHHETHMPGMLTREEMGQLAAAASAAFDRLFLFYMIRHHEGALVMVQDLHAAERGAQAPEVFRFASDIDADQRAEIRRMRALLDALPPAPTPAPHHH